MATKDNFWSNGGHTAGARTAAPAQATKPAPMTYRAPKLYRGGVENERFDAVGNPANYHYGEGQSAIPSSVSVETSDRLAAVQATNPDAMRDKLVANGAGGEAVDPAQVRTLEKRNVPIHPHMSQKDGTAGNPSSIQPGGVNAFRNASLPSKIGASTAQPVRKPC